MKLPKLPLARVTKWVSKYWAFRGGLDQTSPTIDVSPGLLRSSNNLEVGINGAYSRIVGYERFDGSPKPSNASYSILPCTITGTPTNGNNVSGFNSGATGVIIASTASSLILTKVVGNFVSGETITGSGASSVTTTGVALVNSASTPALNATYTNLAADHYRSIIGAISGSGNVLGVWKFKNKVYAFRNNTGGTAALMWVEGQNDGWELLNLGRELAYTNGQTQLVVGATITGATSGATAVIGQISVTSGTLGAGTAAGFIYFASQTGTFVAENINVAGVARGTIAGNSTAITLAANGRYEFVNANFGGSAGSTKMYGCSGVHKAFEFDGTTFAFVTTGMPTGDTPKHIAAHKNHLFLSFQGSAQHSGIGAPLTWTIVTGAAELAMGDTITAFRPTSGDNNAAALIIQSRNSTKVLYGESSANWKLVDFNPDSGALEWTTQWLGDFSVRLDDSGITTTSTSQRFGNFQESDIAARVQPLVDSMRSSAIASTIARKKNQYRLFSSGGNALFVTFKEGKAIGFMPVSFINPVLCVCSLEAGSGEEEIFFGSSNGMVYQMDKGTSMDGAAIAWSCDFTYNHFGSPEQLKSFIKATLDLSGAGYHSFSVGYAIAYGSTNIPQGATTTHTSNLEVAKWDDFTWDQFYWDGQSVSPSEVTLSGTGENISLALSGSSDEFSTITFNGAVVTYKPRRNKH